MDFSKWSRRPDVNHFIESQCRCEQDTKQQNESTNPPLMHFLCKSNIKINWSTLDAVAVSRMYRVKVRCRTSSLHADECKLKIPSKTGRRNKINCKLKKNLNCKMWTVSASSRWCAWRCTWVRHTPMNQSDHFRFNWWTTMIRCRLACTLSISKEKSYLFIVHRSEMFDSLSAAGASNRNEMKIRKMCLGKNCVVKNMCAKVEKFFWKWVFVTQFVYMQCYSSVCFMLLFTCLPVRTSPSAGPPVRPRPTSAFIGFSFCPRCRRPT